MTAQKEHIQFQINGIILLQIIKYAKLSAWIEKKMTHSLYWFTNQELHSVPPHTKVW